MPDMPSITKAFGLKWRLHYNSVWVYLCYCRLMSWQLQSVSNCNSAEDHKCTMSAKHNYIGIISIFPHLLTFMLPKTHMTHLEHKRRNLEESLLLGVLLHRMWMRMLSILKKKKTHNKMIVKEVHSTCVLWNLLCIYAYSNLACCIWFRGTWEHC